METPATRVPCRYGSECKRANPDHFLKCSHPGDADYAIAGTTADVVSGYPAMTAASKGKGKGTAPKPCEASDGDCASVRPGNETTDGKDEKMVSGKGGKERDSCKTIDGTSTAAIRPPCRYGDKCTRKNPDHFNTCSHPGDVDYSVTLLTSRSTAGESSKSVLKSKVEKDVAAEKDASAEKNGGAQKEAVRKDAAAKKDAAAPGVRSAWAADSKLPDPEPLNEDEIKKQVALGPQSMRGGLKFDSATLGPAVAGDPHARRCFERMLENERKYCGGWAVFYHSYSDAAIVYEVQAAVAAVLFRFHSQRATLPRLLRGRFSEVPDAPTMMKVFPTWRDQDHNACFKSVGLCATTTLLGDDAEAPPKRVFLSGYSMGCPAASLIEALLSSCGLQKKDAKEQAPKIIQLAKKSGLIAGGARSGHLLQIFMKRHLVNKYAYASFPMGVPDHSRMPLDRNLSRSGFIQGQVRMVVHPSAFLRSSKVHMFTFSADETFHKTRSSFQQELVKILGAALGDAEKRERAAKGIFGGSLPSWFSADDQRDCLKTDVEIKSAKAQLAAALASGDPAKLRVAVARARQIESFAEADLAEAESALHDADAAAEPPVSDAEGADSSMLGDAAADPPACWDDAEGGDGASEPPVSVVGTDAMNDAAEVAAEDTHEEGKELFDDMEDDTSGMETFSKLFECARLDMYADAACIWFRQHALNDCTEVVPIMDELCTDLGLKPLERKRLEKALMCKEVEGLRDALEDSHLLKHSDAVASWCHQQGINHCMGIVPVSGELADHLKLKPLQQKRLEKALLANSSNAAPASPADTPLPDTSA